MKLQMIQVMKFHYPINKADMSAFPEIPHTAAVVSREQAVFRT